MASRDRPRRASTLSDDGAGSQEPESPRLGPAVPRSKKRQAAMRRLGGGMAAPDPGYDGDGAVGGQQRPGWSRTGGGGAGSRTPKGGGGDKRRLGLRDRAQSFYYHRDRRGHRGGLLQVRDVRCIDTSFSVSHVPSLLARRHAIVVTAEPVKAMILADKCFLFIEAGADSILQVMMDRLRRPPEDPDEEPPFELKALEAVLRTITGELEREARSLQRRVRQLVNAMRRSANALRFDELRMLKRDLTSFHKHRVKAVQRMITGVLDDPYDMAMMYLTRSAEDAAYDPGLVADPSAYEEVELMLESYLALVDSTLSDVEVLRDDVDSSEAQAQMNLDLSRNRLHKLGIFMSLLSASVGTGAMVAGFFGMNLRSGYETDEHFFGRVTILTTGGVLLLATIVSVVLFKAEL